MVQDFNTDIQNIIPVARNYINKANIDKNKNGLIDKNEVSKLLAGTLATSIEDITFDNIHQKMLNNDTEKVFTAFMTDKSMQRNENNSENYLDNAQSKIESNYNRLIKVNDKVIGNLEQVQSDIAEISAILKTNNNRPMLTDKQLNDTSAKLFNARSTILEIMNTLNGQYDSRVTQQQHDTLVIMSEKLLHQIDLAQKQATGNWPKHYNAECINDIYSVEEQVKSAISDVQSLNAQYKEQKELDLNLLDKLSQCQKRFAEDGVASDEEKQESKELLKELIEQTSPMARNIVIQAAENAYNPSDDYEPTMPIEPDELSDGVDQNSVENQSIKRSSYKTPTEIYTLRGNTVIVTSYNATVLRSETFDPSIHKQFFK